MKQTEAAYLAGLIDGEGTISLRQIMVPSYKRGWCWRPLVQIANSDNKMLDRVVEMTGIGWHKCIHYYKGQKLPARIWKITGSADCLSFLTTVTPYLVTKRVHAVLLAKACSLILSLPKCKTGKGYESKFQKLTPSLIQIHDTLAQLNVRGARWRKKRLKLKQR